MINWIINNWIEIFGALAGFIYIFLEIKENKLMWPVGIITSVFYFFVFFYSKFYADMSLQIYYIIISFYGWYVWGKGSKLTEKGNVEIRKLNKLLAGKLLLATTFIYVIISIILVYYTDSPLPYWDAFTTALSITATWMLVEKILEQWIVWIVINAVSLSLYFYRELYPTTILFFIYMVLAIIGYLQWKKSYKQSHELM